MLGGAVDVTGTATGNLPSSSYTIDVYASSSCDPSGNGEGARYLGSYSTLLGAFDTNDNILGPVSPGDAITATTTDGLGNTSEFSNCVTIPGGGGTLSGSVQLDPGGGSAQPVDLSGGRDDRLGDLGLRGQRHEHLARTRRAQARRLGDQRPDEHRPAAVGAAARARAVPAGVLVLVVERRRPADGGEASRPACSTTASDPGLPRDLEHARPRLQLRCTRRHHQPDADDLRRDQPRGGAADRDALRRLGTAVHRHAAGGADLRTGIYTLTYAAASAGQHLHVDWTESLDNCSAFRCDNAAIYAVALSSSAPPPPPTPTVSLTPDASSVQAGAARVQLKDIPASAFLDTTPPLNSAPVGSIPVGSIPVGSIPVGSIPVGSIPVGSIGLTAAQSLLSSIALSTVPLVPPRTWAAILAGTPFATLPLQNVTLADVLGNATAARNLSSVPVGSIDLTRSPLGSLTPATIGLGSTPVGSIPVPPADGEPSTDSTLVRWCVWLHGPPVNCTSTTSLGDTTVVSAALQGAPVGSIPVGSIPVGSIPVGSIPVGSIPLGSIPVGSITVQRVNIGYSPIGSIPLGSIPVGSIPVGSIPIGSIPVGSIDLANSPLGSIPVASIADLTSVFDCRVACPTGGLLRNAVLLPGLTLEQLLRAVVPGALDHITFADLIAFTAPATLHGYTVADLVNSLPPSSGMTYADVLALLLDPSSLNWETLDLNATPVQGFATGGSTLGYHADFTLAPNGGPSDVPHPSKLDVHLPAGFLYEPGTSHLLVNDDGFIDAPEQPGDPTTLPDGTLSWSVATLVGHDYRLTFTVRPGLTLGLNAAGAKLIPSGDPSVGAPPQPVSVGDTLEPNDTPATAHPLSTSDFYLSYLTSKSDVDYHSFPVPSAGTRVTFTLSHLPADYDLVVYGPAGAQQLRPAQPTTPPIDGQPLADNGFATTHSIDPLAPQTLNDLALASGLPIYGVSTLRGTQDDAVTIVSDGGPGVYTVQVSGFDGASSNDPYMLRVETAPPPIAPACVPRAFGSTGTQAPALVTVAAGQAASAVKTLFVVNDQQLGSTYATGASVVTKLNAATTLSGFRHCRVSRRRSCTSTRTQPSAPRPPRGTRAHPIRRRRTRPSSRSPTCSTACGRRTRTPSTSSSSAATT